MKCKQTLGKELNTWPLLCIPGGGVDILKKL